MIKVHASIYLLFFIVCSSNTVANPRILNDINNFISLDNLLLETLEQIEKEVPAATGIELDEWENYSFLSNLISSSYASSIENICFFGGWPSKVKGGKCTPPYKRLVWRNDYIKSLGSTYTRAQYCGSESLMRCPHELFGQVSTGKGPCVQVDNRLDFTKSCIEYAKKNQAKRISKMRANPALFKKYMKRAELILETCNYSSEEMNSCLNLRSFLIYENNLMCNLTLSSSPSSMTTLSENVSEITVKLENESDSNLTPRVKSNMGHIPLKETELNGNAELKYPGLKSRVLKTITNYLDMDTFCQRHNKFRRQCLGTAAGFSTALIEDVATGNNLQRKNKRPYILYSNLKKIKRINGTKVRGRTIPEINSPEFNQSNVPGMMIHTRCNCKKARWSYDQEHDAHHWTVYAGLYNGEPMYFDNTSQSMFKGCRRCKKDKIKNCKKTAQCLKDCREKHRANGTPKNKWCDPNNPKTCLMSGKKYEASMSHGGWANVRKYCKKGENPCIYSVRNPFSDLK